MALHPGLRVGLALARPLLRQDRALPVAERRAKAHRADRAVIALSRPVGSAVSTRDRLVEVAGGSITVRVYTPPGAGPFGAHLYLHGGAFWLGTLDGYDPLCRLYAERGRCVVVSVGYRLAPEHTYPTPPEDCYAAWLWLHENAGDLEVDPASVSVGGTSAGGSLAAAVALMARDRGGPAPVAQVLEIPTTDTDLDYPSVTAYGTGHGLTREDMQEAVRFYLADPCQGAESYASPVRTADLSGLAPAFVFTCECDPLRDQGEAYGKRLRAAGVPTTVRRYRGHVHASTYFTRLFPSARAYVDDIAAVLRSTHGAGRQTPDLAPRRGVDVL